MQVRTALQNNILIPVNKKQRERYKTASELIAADRGGFVYQPVIGLHRDVAELDFFSMYPSIMAKWNISPETVGVEGNKTLRVPGLNRPISQDIKGVVASILEPVLEKRRRAKASLAAGVGDAEDAKYLDVTADTLKGLGWVSFGYQGFSGNRIGSIEAHESITAISRELTLRAKEAAEEWGFLVLHMYVDCLFISTPGKRAPKDFQPLLTEIGKRAEIPIELEGIFNWIAFLPSKESASVPVPNCYFGVFQDGELKCRGIMARKHDTPLFIQQTQLDAIHIFAREPNFDNLRRHIPKVIYFLRSKYSELISGQVPFEKLKIAQRLSRDLDDYRVFSATARAGLLLTANQKQTGAGHTIEYLRVKGSPDVLPWDLSADKEIHLDLDWYGELFFRAAHEILQPFGVEKKTLIDWIVSQAGYFRPEDYVNAAPKDLPLFEAMWEVSKGPLNSSGS